MIDTLSYGGVMVLAFVSGWVVSFKLQAGLRLLRSASDPDGSGD